MPISKERKEVLDRLDSGAPLTELKTLLDAYLAKNPNALEKGHSEHALRHVNALIERSLERPVTDESKLRLRRILAYTE